MTDTRTPYVHRLNDSNVLVDDHNGDVMWNISNGVVAILVGDRYYAVSGNQGATNRMDLPEDVSPAAWWRAAYGGRYADSYDRAETLLTRADLATNAAGVTDVTPVTYTHSLDGYVVQEDDHADTVTLFSAGGDNLVTVTVTPRGKWRFWSSDFYRRPVPLSVWDRARFDTPREAIAEIARRAGVVFLPVCDWLDEVPTLAA